MTRPQRILGRTLLRNLRGIPAATQGADQFYAGGVTPAAQCGLGALVLDQRCFCGEDFEIGGGAAFVALVGDVEGVLCVGYGGSFSHLFLFQDAQVGEFVLYFVEREEDDAFVAGGAGFELVAGLVGDGSAFAAVKQ